MHLSSILTLGATALPLVVAGVKNKGCTQPYYPPAADCVEYTVPVTITSENLIFNYTRWTDDFSLQNFLTQVTTRPSAGYPGVIEGTKNETASYKIAASFCTPKSAKGKKKTVILATHGIGQARTHWNSPFKPEEYNFVQFAIDKGYSVFFYDRLGCGDSEKYALRAPRLDKRNPS